MHLTRKKNQMTHSLTKVLRSVVYLNLMQLISSFVSAKRFKWTSNLELNFALKQSQQKNLRRSHKKQQRNQNTKSCFQNIRMFCASLIPKICTKSIHFRFQGIVAREVNKFPVWDRLNIEGTIRENGLLFPGIRIKITGKNSASKCIKSIQMC